LPLDEVIAKAAAAAALLAFAFFPPALRTIRLARMRLVTATRTGAAVALQFTIPRATTIVTVDRSHRVTNCFADVVPLLILATAGVLDDDRRGVLFRVVHAE
jgi:hypothetical protein